MPSNIHEEDILDGLYEEAYEYYYNDGFRGNQLCILARQDAHHRYKNGQYNLADYEPD